MQENGVIKAFAFGSSVKGDSHVDSDVDFIISFEPGTDYETCANNYFNLLHALQNLLKKEVDLLAEETITNPYLKESIDLHKIQVL